MFWLLRSTFTLLLTAAVCALIVTVPVGRRTLFEHAVAILSTEPARQLGEDLWETGRSVADRAKEALDGQPEAEAPDREQRPQGGAIASGPTLGNP